MLLISPQKLFFFPRYLSFCLDVLVMYQKGLIKKIMLISNIIKSQSGQQTIVIHILPNISRSKSNQTTKFCQLIECKMINIFLKKSYIKSGGKTNSSPFSEKLKLHISGSIVYSFIQFAFIVWQVKGYRNISKLSCRHFDFTSY